MVRTFEVGRTSVDCITFGVGERTLVVLPGLCLHPLAPSAAAIAAQFRCLASDFTVHLIDHETRVPDGFGLDDMARDAIEALRLLDVKRCSIYGVSKGGMLAQLVAQRSPELVEALVLGSTTVKMADELEALVGAWIELAQSGDVVALNRSFFERVYSPEYRQKNAAAFSLIETLGTPAELERFIRLGKACSKLDSFNLASSNATLSCPALVLAPTADQVIPHRCALELAQTLQNCRLEVFEGASHAVYDENPAILPLIRDFLLSAC